MMISASVEEVSLILDLGKGLHHPNLSNHIASLDSQKARTTISAGVESGSFSRVSDLSILESLESLDSLDSLDSLESLESLDFLSTRAPGLPVTVILTNLLKRKKLQGSSWKS
jgi:hypothetical protein